MLNFPVSSQIIVQHEKINKFNYPGILHSFDWQYYWGGLNILYLKLQKKQKFTHFKDNHLYKSQISLADWLITKISWTMRNRKKHEFHTGVTLGSQVTSKKEISTLIKYRHHHHIDGIFYIKYFLKIMIMPIFNLILFLSIN